MIKKIGIGFAVLIIIIIAIGIFVPTTPSLEIKSFKDGDETTTELFEVSGSYKGLYQVKINGEDVSHDESNRTFSKNLSLQNGVNLVKVEGIKNGQVVVTKESKISFDLEGMLFLEKQELANKQEEEKRRELDRVPEYEIVRKENLEEGYSAIVYVKDEDLQDFLVPNLVRDIKSKQDASKISLLFFLKSDKSVVEESLESTNENVALKAISTKSKAEYQKTPDGEELFYFPSGLSGEKLALEIK